MNHPTQPRRRTGIETFVDRKKVMRRAGKVATIKIAPSNSFAARMFAVWQRAQQRRPIP